MGKVNCITFDKTGTLTYGKLEVSDVVTFLPTVGELDLLKITASVEARSEHPLGKAIVKYAKSENIVLTEVKDFQMIPGKGVRAGNIICGNSSFLTENGVVLENSVVLALKNLRNEGKASVLTAIDGYCIGVIALSDTLRPTAKQWWNNWRT